MIVDLPVLVRRAIDLGIFVSVHRPLLSGYDTRRGADVLKDLAANTTTGAQEYEALLKLSKMDLWCLLAHLLYESHIEFGLVTDCNVYLEQYISDIGLTQEEQTEIKRALRGDKTP